MLFLGLITEEVTWLLPIPLVHLYKWKQTNENPEVPCLMFLCVCLSVFPLCVFIFFVCVYVWDARIDLRAFCILGKQSSIGFHLSLCVGCIDKEIL